MTIVTSPCTLSLELLSGFKSGTMNSNIAKFDYQVPLKKHVQIYAVTEHVNSYINNDLCLFFLYIERK